MIDPCINKVFKQDKKVFLPDFGAILYSEASDSIDFNDLLTFDDGKVVEEIRARKKMTEKQAIEALKEHIDTIKAKLDDGNPHLIRGLGYLFKDEQGSYAIQKKKPVVQAKEERTIGETEPEEQIDPQQQIESVEEENNETENPDPVIDLPQIEEIQSTEIEPDLIIGQELEEEEEIAYEEKMAVGTEDATDTTETNEISSDDDEQSYSYKPVLSAEDENVQDYYKRKEELNDEKNKRRPLYIAIAAAVIILLIASVVLYYFNFFANDKISKSEKISMSSTEGPAPEKTGANSESESLASDASDSNNESIQESNPKDGSGSENQNNTFEPIGEEKSSASSVNASQNDKIYSLIVGSFKIEDNANSYQRHLSRKGKEVSIFRRGGNFHFVGYEQIAGKSSAVKLLSEMREEEPTAWIIRNKQF